MYPEGRSKHFRGVINTENVLEKKEQED